MESSILGQLLGLSFYVIFMGFCFCDGFKLHILRKLVWFSVFIASSIYTIKVKGEFDLAFIVIIGSILAVLLCGYEKNKRNKNGNI